MASPQHAYAHPAMRASDDEVTDPTSAGTRARTRRLATELRGLVTDVIDRDLSSDAVDELIAGVEHLRTRAVGPKRRRYYDRELLGSPSDSFIDYSPISGRSHPWAIPMVVEPAVSAEGTPGVRAVLRIGPTHEGPPRGVHGGVIAAVFDELLGHAQSQHGIQALTASLTARYRSVTPIDEELEFFAQVVHSNGRRWDGRAWCSVGSTVTAEAHALFVGVDLDAVGPQPTN